MIDGRHRWSLANHALPEDEPPCPSEDPWPLDSATGPVEPDTAGAAQQHHRKRGTASWLARILLVVVLWVPQPLLFLYVLFDGRNAYGFLGGSVTVFVGVLLVLLTVLVFMAKRKHRPTLVVGCACAALLALVGVNCLYVNSLFIDAETYDNAMAQKMTDYALDSNLAQGFEQYRPFTSDKIARLDGESTLHFSAGDDLPHVDSATALLPLASAFVTAVYPQETTTVGWEGSDYTDSYTEGHAAGFMECYMAGGDDAKIGEYFTPDTGTVQSAYSEGFAAGWNDGKKALSDGVDQHTEEYFERLGQFEPKTKESFASLDAIFQYNNSSTGFTELANHRTDVFFGTKADSDQEQTAREAGVEFEYTPVGREGFVFVVNADNPVDSLTIDQVKGIYSGRISNWKQVGGGDEPIVAYQRNENSGSQSMMTRFMGDTPLMAPKSKMQSSGSMGGLVRAVADYDNGRGAIGYSFRYYVTDLVGDYNVKLLAVEGVQPTARNIQSDSYPITGEFYAVTRQGDTSANLARFLEWVRGEQGQELVEKSGYAKLR